MNAGNFLRVAEIAFELFGVDSDEWQGPRLLEEDLNLDSLDKVELVLALEHEFQITISDEEADGMRNVADVSRLVDAKSKDSNVWAQH